MLALIAAPAFGKLVRYRRKKNLAHQIDRVPRAQLGHDIRTVELDGALADAEEARDLLTGKSIDDLSEYDPLPGSQNFMTRK